MLLRLLASLGLLAVLALHPGLLGLGLGSLGSLAALAPCRRVPGLPELAGCSLPRRLLL